MEFPIEVTCHILSFLEYRDLFNFRSTCKQNNEIFKKHFTKGLIAQYKNVIVIKKYNNYYKFDETCMRRAVGIYGSYTVNTGDGNTIAKWYDDSMVKIKITIAHGNEVSSCILVSPKGIRAEIVRFMISSYYMYALADYVICDAFGYTFELDPEYKLTSNCETMFMGRYTHTY